MKTFQAITKIRVLRAFAIGLLLVLMIGVPSASVRASNDSDVRGAVDWVFQSLKNKNYESLYDALPANFRSRISRDRFASSLRRSQDSYELDKLEIGAIKVAGNLAVVDTVLYGRLVRPLNLEGKIVVQQYLIREDGKWKVATGDDATIQKFLKSNSAFNKFRIRPPKVFVKKDGAWVEFVPPKRNQGKA